MLVAVAMVVVCVCCQGAAGGRGEQRGRGCGRCLSVIQPHITPAHGLQGNHLQEGIVCSSEIKALLGVSPLTDNEDESQPGLPRKNVN